jgi:hypothetical protein
MLYGSYNIISKPSKNEEEEIIKAKKMKKAK